LQARALVPNPIFATMAEEEERNVKKQKLEDQTVFLNGEEEAEEEEVEAEGDDGDVEGDEEDGHEYEEDDPEEEARLLQLALVKLEEVQADLEKVMPTRSFGNQVLVYMWCEALESTHTLLQHVLESQKFNYSHYSAQCPAHCLFITPPDLRKLLLCFGVPPIGNR
jgi:hypothetical protein